MSLDDYLANVEDEVEGTAFSFSEYDTLVMAAFNGGLVEPPEDFDAEIVAVPKELMDWLHFCEYIRSANAILHLVLSGVLAPTQVDELDLEYPGYRYEKTPNADAIIQNLGVGKL